MTLKLNKSKLIKRVLIALLVMACAGAFIAHKIVQRYGFDGIGEFITVYRHNLDLAAMVEPQEIQLKLSDADYEFLKKRRDVALERGIQINDGEDNYVDCKIIQGSDTLNGELRLKGHMTDHLEGDKWSFRVKSKKKPVLGMKRFSLQAPGTRNYAYEWVYHQLLKEEDVIHLYYDFIRLKLNEKDLGIYAVEEHFGQHVLERNNRPPGAILRWNPNLYWEGRIDELQGTYLDEQYSDYASSFVEPYDRGVVRDDSNLVATYIKGATLLEEFRRGEKSTSEVFDLLKLARFHAIIDLVGGQHSLDWSDVKFFYNASTEKIEPVGYESFSVRKTISIAGQRIPDIYEKPDFNYHNQIFSDPVFFEVYIQELERIASEEYLHTFIQKIQPELDKKLGVLAHEFPYRKFSFDGYFENIELIRHNLKLPKPFHAFLESSTDSTVQLSLTPVSDFPIEVLSLSVNGKNEFGLDSLFILPAKARNTYAHYFRLEFKYDSKKLKDLKLKARIPGSSFVFEIEVSDLPSYQSVFSTSPSAISEGEKVNALLYPVNDSVLLFNSRIVKIDGPIRIHENQTLKILPGQEIHFLEPASIYCEGKIEMYGGTEDEERILIYGVNNLNADNNLSGIITMNHAELVCVNVDFFQTNKLFNLLESNAFFKQCTFAETQQDLCKALSSEIVMDACHAGSFYSLGTFDRCLIRIQDFEAHGGDTFIQSYGSDVDLFFLKLEGYNCLATLDYSSSLSTWRSVYSVDELVVSLGHASVCNFFGCEISSVPAGFQLDTVKDKLPGKSEYRLYKTESDNIGQLEI